MTVDLGDEIVAIARNAWRIDFPAEETLPHERRKAEALTLVACESGDIEAREVASAAWRRVRELQDLA